MLNPASFESFVVYKYRPLGLDDFISKEVYRNDRKQRKITKEKEIAIGENFWRGSCVVIFLYEKLHSLTWYTGGKSKKRVEWESRRKEEKRNKLAELHLTETQISKLCVPNIIGLGKLKCIAVPPEDGCGFSKRGILAIVKGCPSLTTLACQEGYCFVEEAITEIVSNNCQLTGLIIPYAFIDDNMFVCHW